MKIGVELGWRAVRIITVGAQNEILSVNDVAQPAVVSTPPIVALSGGGALVGQAAIDLVRDEQQAGNLVTIGHALAGLGDSNHSPELLAVLLEKIGRDIEGFGSIRSNVAFIVSDDIIARDERGDAARDQLAKAAAWANFKNPSLLYRVEAAAREGLDTYSKAELDALTIATRPVVRTLVIDAGPLSLSASTLGIVFEENRHVGPTTRRALWAGRPAAAPGGLPDGEADTKAEQSIALAFDMFRHFAQTVEAQAGASFSAPTLDRIWELVRSPHSPPFQPVIDSVGTRHLFDVKECRRNLADAVRRDLPGLLADFKTHSDHSFIFIGGQYATIAEVNEAIREVCKQRLGPTLHFTELPAHGVAGAVRFDDLSSVPLVTPTPLQEAPKSLSDIQGKPINDGELDCLPQEKKKGGGTSVVSEPNLLDPIVSPIPFDLTRGVDEAGKQVGVFWAEKIDRLLRLRGTAPSVGLKEHYERHLRKAGIGETVQRVGPDGLASLWKRMFGPRTVDDATTNPSKVYLRPAIVDGLVAELQALAGTVVFDKASAKASVEASFRNATEFRDAEQLQISEHFATYVSSQRNGAVPESTALALFNGYGSSGAKRPAGVSVPDQIILTDAGVTRTRLSGRTRHHTLGYAPEGFRSILASSSRTIRRWQFMPWFRWLMGGHVSLVQMVGIVALFAIVLTLSGMSIVRALQPTLLYADTEGGVLDCSAPDPESTDPAKPHNVTCTGATEASFGASSRFHDGCYLNVLRLVLPGQNLPFGVEQVSSIWAPSESDADLVCQESNGFDMLGILNDHKNLDKLTFLLRQRPEGPEGAAGPAISTGQSPDARYAWRFVDFKFPADPPVGPVKLVDITWLSAAPGPEGIPLRSPFNFVVSDSQNSNTQLQVTESGLCVDVGARLSIVAIGSGKNPADKLASIVSDGPGKDIEFIRFAIKDKPNLASINKPLANNKLFMTRTARADPAGFGPPPNRNDMLQIYPDMHELLRKAPPLGLGRPRLVGTCT
ncbi:hypothetical protein [Mesorhizobium sp. KR1-2]|uniref:hypothetical protein n=1 Tax=Mesorhizobium sp. KR1-2 TaxID=3156609 RepID=UPI0032B5CF1E